MARIYLALVGVPYCSLLAKKRLRKFAGQLLKADRRGQVLDVIAVSCQ